MNAAALAKALGGKASGRGYVVRCVAHDDRNPSLSIADGADGRLLVRCHAGCNPTDVLARLRRLGLNDDLRSDSRRQLASPRRPAASALAPNALPYSEKLIGILRLCQPINHAAPVLAWLSARGVAVPTSGDLRYLPPSAKHPWPTMVGIITDFATGERRSLHFTSLSLDGRTKAPIEKPRRLLARHRKAGGVIRLTDAAEVTTRLGLAEGIETALAVAKVVGPMLPIWSAIDAGNLASLPVIAGIETLTIFADTDPSGTGQAAARSLAARWHAAGRDVYIALPPAPIGGKADWNDVVEAA